jgi:hypothetical protein
MASAMNPPRSALVYPDKYQWVDLQTISPRKFKCYHCESLVASKEGYQQVDKGSMHSDPGVYICPNCSMPTYFSSNENQVPPAIFGESLSSLPPAVKIVYDEARNCYGIRAYTSTVTNCRSLLAYIAVDKGAKMDLSFKEYINFLQSESWLPKGTSEWVDEIRNMGNIAVHERSRCVLDSSFYIYVATEYL